MSALDIFSIVAIGAGSFFFLAGTVGLLRFPDALTRLHALTKADNLGLGLVVLGLLPRADGVRRRPQAVADLAARAVRQRGCPRSSSRAWRARASHAHELADAFSIGLALVVAGLALWTVAARDTFAAVVGFVAYGLLLSLVWVRLDRLRRGADRGRDRQRPDRRAADRRRRAPARHRGRGECASVPAA